MLISVLITPCYQDEITSVFLWSPQFEDKISLRVESKLCYFRVRWLFTGSQFGTANLLKCRVTVQLYCHVLELISIQQPLWFFLPLFPTLYVLILVYQIGFVNKTNTFPSCLNNFLNCSQSWLYFSVLLLLFQRLMMATQLFLLSLWEFLLVYLFLITSCGLLAAVKLVEGKNKNEDRKSDMKRLNT